MESITVRAPVSSDGKKAPSTLAPLPWAAWARTLVLAFAFAALSAWGITVSVLLAQKSSTAPLASVSPSPSTLPSPSSSPAPGLPIGSSVDIAVIGGGPGGAYSAWRLQGQPGADVHLYEQSERLGGRTYSVPVNPDCPEVVAELGGMRLRVGVDKVALRVCELLGIPLLPFWMNGEGDTPEDDPLNTMLLRGVRLLRGAYANLTLGDARAALEYNLQGAMPALSNPALPLSYFTGAVADALISVVRPVPDPCAGDVNVAATFTQPLEGQPMYQWSYSTLQQRLGLWRDWGLFADDTAAYDFQSSVPSAYWAMEAIMANITGWTLQRYVRPERGMSQITNSLVSAFTALRADAKLPGSGVHLSRRFLGVTRVDAPAGRYLLTFAVTQSNLCTRLTKPLEEPLKRVYVYANEIVFSVTQQSLVLMRAPDNCLFGPVANSLDFALSQVISVNALKLYVIYNNAPANWFNRVMNSTAGRHIHSEYDAQVFSWFPGTSANVSAVSPMCSNMTVLQLYTIGDERQKFWRSQEVQKLRDAPLCPDLPPVVFGSPSVPSAVLGGAVDAVDAKCATCFPPSRYFGPASDGTPLEMAAAVQTSLSLLTGVPVAQLPVPSSIKYQLWDSSDANAGVTLWVAGAPWWSITERMRQPKADEFIYLVGESWANSGGQGWVEGALETAERMLTLSKGLQPLSGLSRADVCRMNPLAQQQIPIVGPSPETIAAGSSDDEYYFREPV